MTGPSGNWHRADMRHLRLCREDAWGECPAAPMWTCLPLAGEGLRMAAEDVLFTPPTFLGGHAAPFHLSEGRRVAGRLTARLWPEASELLLAATLERTGGAMPSYCLDWYAPSGSRRFLGVMAGTMELNGRGAAECVLSLDLLARSEEAASGLAPGDFDYAGISPVPFGLRSAAVSLDGAALTDVEQFRLRVDNGLDAGPLRLGAPAFIAPGKRTVELELTRLASSDDLAAAVREGAELAFSLTLAHPAGHTASVSLPCLRGESDRALPRPGELVRETVRLHAAAGPGGEEITWTVQLT